MFHILSSLTKYLQTFFIDTRKFIASATLYLFPWIENESNKKRKRKHGFFFGYPIFLKTKNSMKLLSDLRTSERNGLFKNVCATSPEDFYFLTLLINPRIWKQDTNFRDCIPVEMRLAITLG